MVEYLDTKNGRIAYNLIKGIGPGIVFLGGLKSDMQGTKAIFLEDWAKAEGRAFLRFDYTGHGMSSGDFVDGCIGDWAQDAMTVIHALTEGPQILVGSSMGGWISLLICREMPEKVAAMVGIAAAPDFTRDMMLNMLNSEQRVELTQRGQVELPSEYSDDPYIITEKLITDGEEHLVLQDELKLPFPVRLFQGTADADVDVSVALKLLDHMSGGDIRLTLVKGADHRFSTPDCLLLISQTLTNVLSTLYSASV